MARRIEPTPVLKGKDAERLLEDVRNTKLTPLIIKHLEECKRQYEFFIKKLKGD